MRTFWLSFCDNRLPSGHQFLGACVVDVTQEDADNIAAFISFAFPQATDGAEWIAAATKKAHREGCNPGGEVASVDITDGPADALAMYPRNRLISREELEAVAPVALMDEL